MGRGEPGYRDCGAMRSDSERSAAVQPWLQHRTTPSRKTRRPSTSQFGTEGRTGSMPVEPAGRRVVTSRPTSNSIIRAARPDRRWSGQDDNDFQVVTSRNDVHAVARRTTELQQPAAEPRLRHRSHRLGEGPLLVQQDHCSRGVRPAARAVERRYAAVVRRSTASCRRRTRNNPALAAARVRQLRPVARVLLR